MSATEWNVRKQPPVVWRPAAAQAQKWGWCESTNLVQILSGEYVHRIGAKLHMSGAKLYWCVQAVTCFLEAGRSDVRPAWTLTLFILIESLITLWNVSSKTTFSYQLVLWDGHTFPCLYHLVYCQCDLIMSMAAAYLWTWVMSEMQKILLSFFITTNSLVASISWPGPIWTDPLSSTLSMNHRRCDPE